MDRRTFVKTLAGLAGAAAVPLHAVAQLRTKAAELEAVPVRTLQPASAALPKAAPAAPSTSTSTAASTSSAPAAATGSSKPSAGYSPGPLGLLLDGSLAGLLTSAEGGDARAEVVSERLGADGIARKHPGGVHYSEFRVELTEAPSGEAAKWIKGMLERKPASRNGAVLSIDLNGARTVQRVFTDGLLTELTFPALDAAEPNPMRVSLAFAPETTKFTAGDSAKLMGAKVSSAKVMRGSNFRFSIAGLESACAKVTKIEALTFKQKTTESAVGETRMPERTATTLELPNLVLSVPDLHAQPFHDWFEESVIKGNAERGEKSGKLELLTSNLKDVLMTLSFHGLAVFEVRASKALANNDQVRRTQVSMYFERVSFG